MTGDSTVVLVVEDNPGDARLIDETLANTPGGTSVHVSRTGDEAIEFVQQRGAYADAPEPDVVLLDWHLPGMTGESVLEAITDELQHVPVVVMTGIEPVDGDLRSSTSDPAAFVTKPANPDEYVEIICSVTDVP